jgi:hypothetical protein
VTDETYHPAFVVHGLAHLRTALGVGRSRAVAVTAITAEGASAYAGAAWFLAMVAAGRADYPDVPLIAILDCGAFAGDAVMALRLGVGHLVFVGHPMAAARLAGIAAQTGARVLTQRPIAFDLLDVANPEQAARNWCQRLPEPERFGY